MSGRERFLITILAAVAILLGGFKLLVEPQMKKLAAAKTSLAEVQAQKLELETNRAGAQTLEAANEMLKKKIAEESARLFPTLSGDMIHVYFHEISVQAGVQFLSLQMSDINIAQVTVPVAPPTDNKYPLKDAADFLLDRSQSAAPAAGGSGQNPALDTVEMISVSMHFKSDYARTRDFLNRLKQSSRTAAVTSVKVSADPNGALDVNVIAACYGAAKLTDDPISQNKLAEGTGKANPFQ